MLYASINPIQSPAYRMGGIVLLLAGAVILAALGFEHFGGYAPCPLCLQERYAYYAGIPALFAALVLIGAEREKAATALFVLVAMAFLINSGLGVYHAGVEWKWWAGPESCAAVARPLSRNAGDLLERAQSARVVRCDEAPWDFAGLSFAGWNAVLSLLLAAGAMSAAIRAWRGA
jgi:disulfide bond formation protein DsbB